MKYCVIIQRYRQIFMIQHANAAYRSIDGTYTSENGRKCPYRSNVGTCTSTGTGGCGKVCQKFLILNTLQNKNPQAH